MTSQWINPVVSWGSREVGWKTGNPSRKNVQVLEYHQAQGRRWYLHLVLGDHVR